MFTVLPPSVLDIIQVAALIIGPGVSDLPRVKGYIANMLSPSERKLFQRRHRTTRKHLPPNAAELELISVWKDLTGTTLEIPLEKRHPEEWVWRPSGWNILEYNEKRRQAHV